MTVALSDDSAASEPWLINWVPAPHIPPYFLHLVCLTERAGRLLQRGELARQGGAVLGLPQALYIGRWSCNFSAASITRCPRRSANPEYLQNRVTA
jgi:hypothetical protein